MTKRTLEGWVAYWTPSPTNQTCRCSGDLQCAACTVRELDESWRRTLAVERSSFHTLRNQYEALRKRVSDASNGSPA